MLVVYKKIQPRVIFVLLFFVVFFPLIPAQAEVTSLDSANIYFLPDYTRFLDPENLFVNIVIDSEEQKINAVEMNVNFDPSKLLVESISFESSFCTIIIDENFSNQDGNINISCGSEISIASSSIQVAKITFKKIQAGWTSLEFGNSSILLSDGLGTNILNTSEYHNIYLIK